MTPYNHNVIGHVVVVHGRIIVIGATDALQQLKLFYPLCSTPNYLSFSILKSDFRTLPDLQSF